MSWAQRLGRVATVALMCIGLLAVTAVTGVKPAHADPSVDHVLVIGVSGLRWDDIDPQKTPNLYALADSGAIGSLSVRAASPLTCPVDGWVTLGAGNRAEGPPHSRYRCIDTFPLAAPVPAADGSARLTDQSELISINRRNPQGAEPGSLASSMKCVSAVGLPAAVGAARTSGRVDNYYEQLPSDPGELFSRCPATLIDIGEVRGPQRDNDLPIIDAEVGKILAARPDNTMVMVVGVSDVSYPPQLHVAIVDGPGFDKKWLDSASTGREPYVQLIDVAPTVLKARDVGVPDSVVGQPMNPGSDRTGSTQDNIDRLVDYNRHAQASRPLVQDSYRFLVAVNLGLMLVAAVFFRRRQLAVGETLPDPAAGHSGRPHLLITGGERRYAWALAAAGLFVASLPVASYLANAMPWWRWTWGTAIFVASIFLIAALLTGVAARGPWRRWHPLGPPSVVALATAAVLAGDVMTGSHLQMNAVSGYSPLVAGRFTGFGNMSWALFAAGVLLGIAYAVQGLDKWQRVAIVSVVGLGAIVVTGAPMWGNDVGGIIALTPAVMVTVMRAAGMWLTPARVLASFLTGIIAVTIFAIIDYLRPAEDRTHLGRFVGQLLDGTGGTILQRKAEANFNLLVSSQLTLLVIGAGLFIPLVLMRRSAGLWRVFGLHPTVRAGAVGVLVAAIIGFALNDSGIAIPAYMVAIVVPLLITTILRVLAEATRGTLAPAGGANSRSPAPDENADLAEPQERS